MSVPQPAGGRAARLDHALADLLGQAPELEAAAVVSFDGLAMASALPPGMDEDRVAAMSAALLSLGEKAAEGLGRGDLSQVYVEGETGTVFLISCQDEAVLVAVAAAGAKAGLMLYEVRRAAVVVGDVLKDAAPPETVATLDDVAMAEAEAAYAAHKASLEVVPAPVEPPLLEIVPAPAEPERPSTSPMLMPVGPATNASPLGEVFRPETVGSVPAPVAAAPWEPYPDHQPTWT
jgi:predicted regulator of Ras-like GTPase activity (Roadblock/LC7/MglB family)